MKLKGHFSVIFFPLLFALSAQAQTLDEDTLNMLAAKFNADLSLAQECDHLHQGFSDAYAAQFSILEPSLVRAGVTKKKMAQVDKTPGLQYTRDLEEFSRAEKSQKYARCLDLLIEVQQNALKRK
jgi:hypothetical protein